MGKKKTSPGPRQKLSEVTMAVSRKEIMSTTTPKGSWNAEILAKWGVKWPAPSGWKRKLIENWDAQNPDSPETKRNRQRAAAKAALEREINVISLEETQAEFMKSDVWYQLRYKVFTVYGRKCMCCGKRYNLDVDHIKPKSRYPELIADFNNLQILCRDCNYGKGNWDETDWRPKPDDDPW